MKALLTPIIVGLLFFCIRSADLAITYGAKSYVRAIAYGVAALLALIVLIMALLA